MEQRRLITKKEFIKEMQAAGFLGAWKFFHDNADKPLSHQREVLKQWGMMIRAEGGGRSNSNEQAEAFQDLGIE